MSIESIVPAMPRYRGGRTGPLPPSPRPSPPPPRRSPSSPPGTSTGRRRIRGPVATRTTLARGLALLWLLDGALQLQPFMFTRGFADKVIAPTAVGQPGVVIAAVHWSVALIGSHPVAFDTIFASVQLGIGAGLCFRRTTRVAIVASLGWAIGVWVFGEGIGGLGAGGSTLVSGAPGAAILYALLGLAAWPRLDAEGRTVLVSSGAGLRAKVAALVTPASAERPERPPRWVPAAWAALWGLFAVLQALPANDSSGDLVRQLRSNLAAAPSWLAHVDHATASLVTHSSPWTVVALVMIEGGIALGAVAPGASRRTAAIAGVVTALVVWVLGQAFGQIPTGMGTDPNTGPLLVLLAVALMGSSGGGVRRRSAVHGRGLVDLRHGREAA